MTKSPQNNSVQRYSKPGLDEARALLETVGLPADDVSGSLLDTFLACREDGKLIAIGGLQIFGEAALLRSLATVSGCEGKGHGSRLVAALERMAKDAGVTNLYLLTTTADRYFSKLGYHEASRDTAPQAIRLCSQFSELCPSSAAFLRKRL